MTFEIFKTFLKSGVIPGIGVLSAFSMASFGSGAVLSKPLNSLSPILFVPGYGMGALHVAVSDGRGEVANFDFLLPSMNPNSIFIPPLTSAKNYALTSGLRIKDLNRVSEWLKLNITADGLAENQPGVEVTPISIGQNFALECPRYTGMMRILASSGWVPNQNLKCIPFDYRFPPGETDFAEDLAIVIKKSVAAANGTKVTLACHSQGCLLAYHFLRTRSPEWLDEHVGLFFSLAGQFSGCSDCLRWAFQKGWSWDPNNDDAAPSDRTWVGELALGLQTSVYGDQVLYRWGKENYRTTDTQRLLREAGAWDVARATDRYALERQPWFQKGAVEHLPLSVPTRIVFGTKLLTTIGFEFRREGPVDPSCRDPLCSGPYYQDDPGKIQAEGDSGDSDWMNQAPRAWLTNPLCEIKELEFVSHMDIFENQEALQLLISTARKIPKVIDHCH